MISNGIHLLLHQINQLKSCDELWLTKSEHFLFPQLTDSVPVSGSLICDHMERWKKIRHKYVFHETQFIPLLKQIVPFLQLTLKSGFHPWF